jgi:photosystem II stability/assembly factor-like uncharacterized protein
MRQPVLVVHTMFAYLALRDGLWVLTGAPDDPTATRRLTGVDPECVTVHPDEPRRVLVGTVEDGLHRSVDGGDTFERVGEGPLASPFVTAVAVNPRDPDEWYAGTEPSAVYRSTDGGATWVRRPGLTDLPSASGWSFPPRPDTHHVRWIEVDPHDPARLYVAIEAGALVRSPDRGETWTDRVPSSRRDNHSLATHPDAPGRVYAAAGDGYAETTDGGETWTYPQTGLDHRYCWSLAVDPGAPDTRLVSAARGAYAAHRVATAESYVYRTGGVGDVEWERVEDGLPTGEGVTRPLLAAGGPGEFYAASNRGLFRSGDAGDSFERVPADLAGVESGPVRGLAVVYE